MGSAAHLVPGTGQGATTSARYLDRPRSRLQNVGFPNQRVCPAAACPGNLSAGHEYVEKSDDNKHERLPRSCVRSSRFTQQLRILRANHLMGFVL